MLFWRGGSNEYPQSMFWSKNKKNTCRYTPAISQFCYIKVGNEGVFIVRICFPDEKDSSLDLFPVTVLYCAPALFNIMLMDAFHDRGIGFPISGTAF